MRVMKTTARSWVLGAIGLGAGCGSETRDLCDGLIVQEGQVCVLSGPITETGFECPPEMPFAYSGELPDDGGEWAMCSSDPSLDPHAIDDAMREAGMGGAEPNEPQFPEPEPEPTAPEDCTGWHAFYKWLCLDDTADPDPSDDCTDEDGDGTCWGYDFEDEDPYVDGTLYEVDGVTYVVGCYAEGTEHESCVGMDLCYRWPWHWEVEPLPEIMVFARELCADYYQGPSMSLDAIDAWGDACAFDAEKNEEVCWQYMIPCLDVNGRITDCAVCDRSPEICQERH